ncbi:MAG TPA: transglutaminaseTgpA domain-containing protein [Thermoanaerobaculia bacterium]|nr:transglutaminaseTgpA domain-containing protein [Thermoanaerobaculia bacterium]
MSRRSREIETLLLTMYAAVPLYLTAAIGVVPVIIFHIAMGATLLRVIRGNGPDLFPSALMRALAVAYVPFYIIDAAILSRSAIAASTHLVLFIAAYQPSESLRSNNQAQRILTTGLIFIASLATSTHIAIILFVITFAFFLFRQLMYVSHMETARSIGREYAEAPSSRAAIFYIAGATLIGAMLFPLLPRVRNPFVQGITGSLPGSSSTLTESIDFTAPRTANNDPTVVARVWMDQQTMPFFTPLRLRGTVYDRFSGGEWKQSRYGIRELSARGTGFTIARPVGFARSAIVQMRPVRGRLFLPVGTYAVNGIPNLYEGPTRDSFFVFQTRGEMLTLNVEMAFDTEPLNARHVPLSGYQAPPAVAAMARQIVGDAADPEAKAARIERYLSSRFTYIANDASSRSMTLDDFLLRQRKGHCEYFAAGMVALLTSLDVPARIAGGFYGGRLNPLTGYFTIRAEDAHAWVEVWNGGRWKTYDPTPASLRPGAVRGGILGMYAAAISDSVNYFWDRYVLTYGLSDQIALAAEMITRTRDAIVNARAGITVGAREVLSQRYLIALGSLIAAGLLLVLIMRRRRPVFALLAEHLQRLGIDVGPATTMEEALARLRAEHPDAALDLAPLIALYEEESFSAHPDPTRARALRRRLSELRV